MNRYKSIFVSIILFLLALFFLLKTSYHLPRTFDNEPGGGAFGGIRLHYLNIWNFDFSQGVSSLGGTSHVLDNFWKSFSYSFHGLLSYLHWYVYVGIFDLFGIPITEGHLLFCQSLLLTVALFIFSLSLQLIYKSWLLAILFLVIASPLLMTYGRSYYVMAPHLFYLSLFFYSVAFYFNRYSEPKNNKISRSREPRNGIFLKIFIGFTLFLNMASGNAILLPLFPLFVWCVAYQKERMGLFLFARKCLKPSHLLFLIPLLLPLAGHLYVYSRVGVSNLGLLGWGFLKLGGVHSGSFDLLSKMSHLKTAFEIYVQNNIFYFWGSVILLVSYFLGLFGRLSSLPVKLFILIYFIYASAIQANIAILPLAFLLSFGMAEIILFFSSFRALGAGNLRWRSIGMTMALAVFFFIGVIKMSDFEGILGLEAFKRPPAQPNDLKAVGYVLREHMTKEDKIASFLSDTDNILNEFYYGKTFFKSPAFGKEIYSLINVTEGGTPVSREEVDREFAFYVVEKKMFESPSAGPFMNSLISKYHLKKFSDIGGKYEIYSSQPIPYQVVDIREANMQFDRKYAHLESLFYHHHVGVASTWGFY